MSFGSFKVLNTILEKLHARFSCLLDPSAKFWRFTLFIFTFPSFDSYLLRLLGDHIY